jgi:hypothetical protein
MSTDTNNQHNEVSGGSVGGIFNGGNHGTIVVNPGPPEEPTQPYSARVVQNLPKQSILAMVTSLITVFTFVTGWKSLSPLVEMVRGFRGGGVLPQAPSGNSHTLWLIGFVVCGLLLGMMLAGLYRVRTQTFQPPRISVFPVLAGITDERGTNRLALVRFSGECVICGGRLRFYDKPTEWHFEVVEGRRKRIVDNREPAAECKKNPKHWYPLEITERIV